jgi:DNA-cytosine methyltransferase
MDTLSFFSGICGLELGIPEYINIKCHCDIDNYCKYIINKKFPNIDFHDNIRTFPKEKYNNINLIMGGFPCQDISNAGKGKGLSGKRSGLFWDLLKIIEYYKPEFVYLENVSNLRNKGLDKVVTSLGELGYDTKWCIIEAVNTGALHKRARTFMLSKNNNKILNKTFPLKQYANFDWIKETDKSRVVDNPNKERIKCLGNAVVPDQSRLAFHILFNSNNTETIYNLETSWNNSLSDWKSIQLDFSKIASLPKSGIYSNGNFYYKKIKLENIAEYPLTIQRFKTTHSLPTPTATDYISRKPTNTLKSRAFRPGVNKSVSLNRWIEMFPSKETIIPELDDEGYLINDDIKGVIPNPQWVEWLMGFPLDWTS